jgi:hypothetical protein
MGNRESREKKASEAARLRQPRRRKVSNTFERNDKPVMQALLDQRLAV